MPPASCADAGDIEVEAVDVRLAAAGDEQMRAVDGRRVALRVGDGEAHAAAAPADRDDLDADAHADALGAQPVDDDGGKLRIDVGQGRAAIDHGGVDAEPVEGLRQLQPLAAGAEHDEMGRLAGEIEGRPAS